MDRHVERVAQLRTELQRKHEQYDQADEDDRPELLQSIQDRTNQLLTEEDALPERQRADRAKAESRKRADQQAAEKEALASSQPALYGASLLCIAIAVAIVATVLWGSTSWVFVFWALACAALGVQIARVTGITEYPPTEREPHPGIPTPLPRQIFAAVGSLAAVACLFLAMGWLPGWLGYILVALCGVPTAMWTIGETEPMPPTSQQTRTS